MSGPPPKFLTRRKVFTAPDTDLGKDWQQGDAFFRETVYRLLSVGGVAGPGEDACLDQLG